MTFVDEQLIFSGVGWGVAYDFSPTRSKEGPWVGTELNL